VKHGVVVTILNGVKRGCDPSYLACKMKDWKVKKERELFVKVE